MDNQNPEEVEVLEDDDILEDWRTTDVILAAWLILEGFECHGTEWLNRKCNWIFEDTAALADAVSEYIGGNAEGNLKAYNEIIARLKSSMYEEEKQQRLGRHAN